MRARCPHHRLTSWIAALAILLAALAPSLSQALGSANGSSWIEVCTSQGSKWIEQGADNGPAAPVTGHAFEHCPFCSLHAPTLGLPPSAQIAPLPIDGRAEFPPAFLAAPRTQHAWLSARPRAPPQFS